jgi:Pyruvate/2-oxoacid:ferredoxin oxidoreductase delta subunit
VAHWSQFEDENEQERKNRPAECELCEAMCPEAVDGTLSEAERRVFDRHVAGCVSCSRELGEAQRGAAWLTMLKGHTPEPPAALLAKILAETTGAETNPLLRDETAQRWGTQGVGDSLPAIVAQPNAAPAWALSSVLRKAAGVFRIENARKTFQPRMAMTAAMAFVSIALTLNLTGVRLRNLRADNFTPSALRRTVADAGASAARTFQNTRVVYQVESRVSELRGEGPLADRIDRTDQATPLVESQPANGTPTDNGMVRHPGHKGL